MKAYKLFKLHKDKSIGSLFINRTERLPLNKWLTAKPYPTKGYSFRPYWHCTNQPVAPHLSMNGRSWYEVEIKDYKQMKRPINQGGIWYLAKKIKIIKEGK